MLRYLAVAFLLSLCACSRSPEQGSVTATTATLRADPAHHLLLTVELSSKGLRLLSQTLVEQPLPRLRVPEPHPWILELRGSDDRKLFETRIPVQNVLRGEFADGASIDGTHKVVERAVFQVRVPAQTGQLRLTETRGVEPRLLGSVELAP